MKPIFATCPINVAGRLYQAGQQIQCGSGTRASLLRFQQAVEGEDEGEQSKIAPTTDPVPPQPSLDGEPTDDADSDSAPLTELLIDAEVVAKLQGHQFQTIEQLQEYLASGKKLRSLTGIGEATEKRILFALEVYDQPDI